MQTAECGAMQYLNNDAGTEVQYPLISRLIRTIYHEQW